MSDILEVIVNEELLEIAFEDEQFAIVILEDNFEIGLDQEQSNIVNVDSDAVEILSLAEQGPPGPGLGDNYIFGIYAGNTPPVGPSIGQLWLDTN